MSFDFIQDIKEIIIRDLNVMKEEVSTTDPSILWESEPGIINSTGTLAYHLCGNLRHFIGAILGKDGYVRDRESEFNSGGFAQNELICCIDDTINALEKAFLHIKPEDLSHPMPDTPPQHNGKSIGFFLIQLVCHLSRHRGQLDYLRRIKAAKMNYRNP